MTSDQERVREAVAQMCRVILGKEKEIREVMTAILANGHILLEDIPGVVRPRWPRPFPESSVWITGGSSSLLM